MKKKISLIVLCTILLLGICGCDSKKEQSNNQLSEKENQKNNESNSFIANKQNIIGTWSYSTRNSEVKEEVTITEDKVSFDNRSYNYVLKDNWIFLEENEAEVVLYILDDKNIIAFEGVVLTK